MKKIILILMSLLLITGCYDNVELDDLSIITGVGIDYIDNNYYVVYEILNDNKSENTMDLLSYTVEGIGSTISGAFTNTNYKVQKKPYYAHLKVVLLSDNIINNHLDDITDYLFRDIKIRDDFLLLVANNTTPKDILTHNSKFHPVATNYIVNLLEKAKYNNGIGITETYKEIMDKLLSKRQDIILNSISIKGNDLSLDSSYIFEGYNSLGTLSTKDSSIYTMLTNKSKSTIFSNNGTVISVNNVDTSYKINPLDIVINLNIEATLLENNTTYDLKDDKSYKKLNDEYKEIIKEDINNFMNVLRNSNSDILGFRDMYYRKEGKDLHNLWQKANIKYLINLEINDKGFIF